MNDSGSIIKDIDTLLIRLKKKLKNAECQLEGNYFNLMKVSLDTQKTILKTIDISSVVCLQTINNLVLFSKELLDDADNNE